MPPVGPKIPDLLLPIDSESDAPLHRQIYKGLRDAIVEGRLTPGTRIPSSRRLADYLAVSRTTVLTAFDQWIAEGFLVGAIGSGSRVADHIPGGTPPAAQVNPSGSQVAALSRRGRDVIDLPRPDYRTPGGLRAFRTGQPPLDGFPRDVWRRLAARRQRGLTAADLCHGPGQGLPQLREAIATLAVARGIRCDPSQVLVLASAQEGLELACRLLLDPGDEAWIEDPAWAGARAALVLAGAKVIPVPIDDAGLVVDAGIAAAPHARLAYVTPSHQYPTGVTMSIDRRRQLLDWAAARSAWILEDDYDSEFRYVDRPLPALKSLDPADRVIYVGTFNKTLFPALRIAYLILPAALVDPFVRARVGGQHPPVLTQKVLSDFITDGHHARHLTRVRALGRERRDALISALAPCGALTFTHIDTGLHAVGWLPPGTGDLAIEAAAARRGVDVGPLSAYYIGHRSRPGLVLGYGGLSTRQIVDGARELMKAVDEAGLQAGTRRSTRRVV